MKYIILSLFILTSGALFSQRDTVFINEIPNSHNLKSDLGGDTIFTFTWYYPTISTTVEQFSDYGNTPYMREILANNIIEEYQELFSKKAAVEALYEEYKKQNTLLQELKYKHTEKKAFFNVLYTDFNDYYESIYGYYIEP